MALFPLLFLKIILYLAACKRGVWNTNRRESPWLRQLKEAKLAAEQEPPSQEREAKRRTDRCRCGSMTCHGVVGRPQPGLRGGSYAAQFPAEERLRRSGGLSGFVCGRPRGRRTRRAGSRSVRGRHRRVFRWRRLGEPRAGVSGRQLERLWLAMRYRRRRPRSGLWESVSCLRCVTQILGEDQII